MKEYKVVVYRESLLGSIILRESKVNPERFSDFLNNHARQGWRVITIEKEKRRELLFFSREAFVTVLEKDV